MLECQIALSEMENALGVRAHPKSPLSVSSELIDTNEREVCGHPEQDADQKSLPTLAGLVP